MTDTTVRRFHRSETRANAWDSITLRLCIAAQHHPAFVYCGTASPAIVYYGTASPCLCVLRHSITLPLCIAARHHPAIVYYGTASPCLCVLRYSITLPWCIAVQHHPVIVYYGTASLSAKPTQVAIRPTISPELCKLYLRIDRLCEDQNTFFPNVINTSRSRSTVR